MRRRSPLLAVALVVAACSPMRAPTATPDPEPEPSAAAPDPAISGVVRSQITGHGAERYEIVASSPKSRADLAGVVEVERLDAAPFAARLALVDVLHHEYPWTVRVEISRFDDDVALPLLTIGETVTLVPVVRIPWLDDRRSMRGVSDVAPRGR
jgi:hypothetical protein